jgi:hypothetical protein
MKCLKNVKTNEIVRVTDKEAYNMAGITWKYIAKSEWKATRPVATQKQEVEAEKKAETIAEKQLKRNKLKEKQRV